MIPVDTVDEHSEAESIGGRRHGPGSVLKVRRWAVHGAMLCDFLIAIQEGSP